MSPQKITVPPKLLDQVQAFNALLFLYKSVLDIQLDAKIQAVRAKRPHHLPTVLTQDEAHKAIHLVGLFREEQRFRFF